MGQEMGLEWKAERTHALQFICKNRVPSASGVSPIVPEALLA